MTFSNLAALAGAMLLLAAIPSVSVLFVLARSSAFGLRHGALASAGIVLGDIALLLVAVFGLSLLATLAAPVLQGLTILAIVYLLWLAYRLWTARGPENSALGPPNASAWASISGGLAITLGDQKAILFYMAFLPAFVDLTAITAFDIGAIIAITVVAVGGAKLAYAGAATLGRRWTSSRQHRLAFRAASVLMALAAIALAFKVVE